MSSPIYRFRDFRLDTRARELTAGSTVVELPASAFDCLSYLIAHRDRPVGRDELIAAIWGRADVSETLLGHAIVRLRRVLSDNGGDQHSIRTLPRVGYRWIVPTTEESPELVAESAPAAVVDLAGHVERSQRPIAPHQAAPAARARAWLLRSMLIACAIGLIAIAVRYATRERVSEPTPPLAAAMVLPAQLDAGAETAWLRLGVMDFLAERLRRAGVATMESDTVIGLVKGRDLAADAWLGEGALARVAPLRIVPKLSLEQQVWVARLEVADGTRRLSVEARAAEPLAAARAAADELLVKLGRAPPHDEERSPELAERIQQIKSATLAGQLDLARTLIRDAPEALRSDSEMAWASALVASTAGDYASARQQLQTALGQLSAEINPTLRARMLNMLGALDVRAGELERAARDYGEAIALTENGRDTLVLAHAYTGRGLVAAAAGRYDEGVADLGRSRTLSNLAGGMLGVAQVDLNLGLIAEERGQLGQALVTLQGAAVRFAELASQEEEVVAIAGIARVERGLLEFPHALTTTDRFWPPDQHTRNIRLGWTLGLARARALADLGRLEEAATIGSQVREAASAGTDAATLAAANATLGYIAMFRGDAEDAQRWLVLALGPVLQNTDRMLYRDTALLHLRALRRMRRIAEAATELAALRPWLRTLPDLQGELYAEFADAEQAKAEGRDQDALAHFATALVRANGLGVPESQVAVAVAYAQCLLDAGRIEEASAVAGGVSGWVDRDLRVAALQTRLLQALHQTDAWRRAAEHARHIAGERVVPDGPALPPL